MFQIFSYLSLLSKPPFCTLLWDAGAATLQTTFQLCQLVEKEKGPYSSHLLPVPPTCFLFLRASFPPRLLHCRSSSFL